jgi:hypothetical protein
MHTNYLTPKTSETGLSLIEILITVVILGAGVIGVVSALASTLRSTAAIRERGDVLQVATRVNDAIQRAPWECNTATPTASFGSTLNALKPTPGWTIAVVAIDHWGPVERRFAGPGGTGCPAATDNPVFKTLRVTVRVKGPGLVREELTTMVKRP